MTREEHQANDLEARHEQYECAIESYHERLAEVGMAYALEGFPPGEAEAMARLWIGPAPQMPKDLADDLAKNAKAHDPGDMDIPF